MFVVKACPTSATTKYRAPEARHTMAHKSVVIRKLNFLVKNVPKIGPKNCPAPSMLLNTAELMLLILSCSEACYSGKMASIISGSAGIRTQGAVIPSRICPNIIRFS